MPLEGYAKDMAKGIIEQLAGQPEDVQIQIIYEVIASIGVNMESKMMHLNEQMDYMKKNRSLLPSLDMAKSPSLK